ncbi:MAG: phosphoribosylamine--glycine ligase [Magnetovibrio sp.]|nr:phosphoribosylamine--glycine ligase [Magnetovibrio sp.]
MRILVIGSGGREHALSWAISKSPKCKKLYCAPGNGGISQVAECVNIAAEDIDSLVKFTLANNIDFVVIGPETPLVLGLTDRLEDVGVKVFGPSAKAAMIEASKGLMKDFCTKFNIPTAEYSRFDECDAAKEYIRGRGAPIVIKADGLAAGKGVVICRSQNEAYATIDHMMKEGQFGAAGTTVVIEEFMEGEEASFFALTDGKNALPLVSAQDHKAAFDGDQGPNTGGMGAYTPTTIIDTRLEKEVMKKIIKPTIEGLAAENMPYKGLLYAGLMITSNGPKLIEYNCRFGDPECQALMVRLKSDALDLLLASVDGCIATIKPRWSTNSALTVVMAAKGYPGIYEKGSVIKGLEKLEKSDDINIFHAGTSYKNGEYIAEGGRVLSITATAPTLEEAQEKAYKAISKIDWPQGFYRKDIGWRAISR